MSTSLPISEALRRKRRRDVGETVIRYLLLLCGLVSIATTIAIVVILFWESVQFFRDPLVSVWEFLTDTQWTPLFTDKHFGVWPLVVGTFMTSAIALIVALPLGLLSAIYLSEYASARTRSILKPILEILAGIPTVVYGYFALLFVTPALQKIIPDLAGFNAISPGIVMGIMILPMVSSLSEDALHAVPKALRDAGYGLGATKFEVATQIVVPAALSGIAASFILAVSRAVGETMIVAIAAGQRPVLTFDPRQPIQTMTAYIVQVSLGDTPAGSLAYKTIFAVAFLLFLMTLSLNVASHFIVRRYRQRYE
ncbi:phosphate transport system permease protein [Ardenticatena maritima]|uniref:Phosphate transport system permease protein n=1 Tax=Ardenticatena maritima TaxID=872965 RepID=A0A0M8KAX5_9CHLR|nr:phosphate ABC transporter permease subunit PstC [Ardenticatena maritima]KPL87872.1 phosphate ABC transporter permease [Ardenticatena maritima]GAP64302.1 phosphate transport system permease protein [Ardenticatena maritima]